MKRMEFGTSNLPKRSRRQASSFATPHALIVQRPEEAYLQCFEQRYIHQATPPRCTKRYFQSENCLFRPNYHALLPEHCLADADAGNRPNAMPVYATNNKKATAWFYIREQ